MRANCSCGRRAPGLSRLIGRDARAPQEAVDVEARLPAHRSTPGRHSLYLSPSGAVGLSSLGIAS